MFSRRTFVKTAMVGATALATPRISIAQGARTLKYIPSADLAVLDPIWTPAYETRDHALMVYDTLYGHDSNYKVSPQMVEGHRVENDGKLWKLTLREGLKFHNGEPVRARDCVASLKRWGQKDSFGHYLLAATDELSAPDDETIVFRLKRPFPLLPDALAKTPSNVAVIMPEAIAKTDASTQITEVIGSGPFRFRGEDRVSGSRYAYERFAGYVPRSSGQSDWTAGPKIANVDRIEWHIIPDAGTAAAALQQGEVDWWKIPTPDLLPLLRKSPRITVHVLDPTGVMGVMRLNHLHPPFNNPAIRRAVLSVVNQSDFMAAIVGDDKSLWRTGVGVFNPASPLASQVGMSKLAGRTDYARVTEEIRATGYKGEKVVLLSATDYPSLKASADVAADLLQKVGFNVDYQALDWGTVVQRRGKKDAPDRGGWNVMFTATGGLDQFNPAVHIMLRANGMNAPFGWPDSPKIESLRESWFTAPDLDAQKKIAADLQEQAFQDVPYIPLGLHFQPTAYRKNITGVLNGSPLFWNLKKA